MLAGLYVTALTVPPLRDFFALSFPTVEIVVTALLGAAIAIGALVLAGFPERDGEQHATSLP